MMTIQNITKEGGNGMPISNYRTLKGNVINFEVRTCKDFDDKDGKELLETFDFLTLVRHTPDEESSNPPQVDSGSSPALVITEELVKEPPTVGDKDLTDIPEAPDNALDGFLAAEAAKDPMICNICEKRCKNGTGLATHKRNAHEKKE